MTGFEALYRAELSYVLHTLRRLGVGRAELEDVAHDVFVAIHRHFGDYDPSRPARPWIFAFAFRMARDHRKLARHHQEVSGNDHDAASPAALPDEALDDARLRLSITKALDALDFEKKSLIVMHALEGMAVPEIAKMLEIPLNTAYSRLRLARAAFDKQLKQAADGERSIP